MKAVEKVILIFGGAMVGFSLLKKSGVIGKLEDFGNPSRGRIDYYWGELDISENLVGRNVNISIKENSPEKIVNMFDLSNVEYGNWMSQQDRVNHTFALLQSLKDLAKCLKVPFIKIGLNQKLGIAMGGRGKSAAAAHYEPGRFTINITKTSGAGALAHEYGHFIDNMLSYRLQKSGKRSYASGGRSTRMVTKEVEINDTIPSLIEQIYDTLFYNKDGSLTSYGEEQTMASEYYRRRTEVFARLTEGIVQMRLQELKINNFYLQDGFAPDIPSVQLIRKVKPLYFKLIKKIYK